MSDRSRIEAALPRYDIGEEIGRGGWAVVLEGRHRDLDRRVAIKELPAEIAIDEQARGRFRDEARVVARLDHPHIVPVYDFVEHDGVLVLVMELCTGGTLWDRHDTRALGHAEVAAIGLVVASALDAAHHHGVLHRDIKPENLLFGERGAIKLSDFGIAKIVGAVQHTRTTAGMIIGTPAYLAPEQVTGRALGPATDIYATSVMLYRLLADDFPFPAVEDSVARLFQHVHEPPLPLGERAEVPGAVASVIMRGLEKDPADRFLTAEAFGLALARGATSVWGPGWLRRSGVELRSAPNLLAATEASRTPTPAGDPHDSAELILLDRLQAGETLGARPDEVEAMRLLLGATGTTAPARLGLPESTDVPAVRAAALEQLSRWRRRAEHPLSGPELRDACLVLSRACESIVTRLG
jgi:serine/threonine-protein kinase